MARAEVGRLQPPRIKQPKDQPEQRKAHTSGHHNVPVTCQKVHDRIRKAGLVDLVQIHVSARDDVQIDVAAGGAVHVLVDVGLVSRDRLTPLGKTHILRASVKGPVYTSTDGIVGVEAAIASFGGKRL